jgi:hypothetical protein
LAAEADVFSPNARFKPLKSPDSAAKIGDYGVSERRFGRRDRRLSPPKSSKIDAFSASTGRANAIESPLWRATGVSRRAMRENRSTFTPRPRRKDRYEE